MFELNKFFFKTNKLLHTYMPKDIIFLIQGGNLFDLNKFLFGSRYFVWIKQILFDSNKSFFFKSMKVFQKNNFHWFNQIFFLSVDGKRENHAVWEWVLYCSIFSFLIISWHVSVHVLCSFINHSCFWVIVHIFMNQLNFL